VAKVIDFTSGGIFAGILGEHPNAVLDAMRSVWPICQYAAHYPSKWTLRYIDMLKEWTGFESVALFTTGAEATEAFWRCCRVFSGKPGIWGGLVDPDEVGTEKPLSDAMHGVTLGAQIMAGKLAWPSIGVHPELGQGRFGLEQNATSGMIMEPYHGPSAQFHKLEPTIKRIINLQENYPNIPLCLDEIQAGFGRTGRKFGYQWYEGFEPDFVTIGKGCGAGLPISALLGPKEIMESDVVIEHAHLHSTHSGHPMMCAAGSAVIEEIEKHGLIDRSQRLGVMLKNLLHDCGVRFHAGRGLLAGIELADAQESARVTKLCDDNGLRVCNTHRKWIKLGPAFTITEDELERGVAILRTAIEDVVNAREPETRGMEGDEPGSGDSRV